MSSSSFLLLRMLVVFLLFCLSKASGAPFTFIVMQVDESNFDADSLVKIRGTCLSYGHSCWGGHGKRSGSAHMIGPFQKHTSGWYVSKLLDTPSKESKNFQDIFKNQNLDSEEMDSFRRSEYQLYPELDAEKDIVGQKGKLETNSERNKWKSETDETEEDIMVLTPEIKSVPLSKLRFLQIMNPENNKPKREY